MKTSGILDIPLQENENDQLQILSFETALTEFIQKTSTPISIALQGEWGSGKTSLMNRLNYEICKTPEATSYGIWLNTWHYALLNHQENILEQIITALIGEVLRVSKTEYPEKFKTLVKDIYQVGKNVLKGVSKIAVKTAVSQVNGDLADAVDETVFSDKAPEHDNLNLLKIKLTELIEQLIQRNIENNKSQRSLVFFIDDLDRIEPALAVNILELLKNIFDIKYCIFVLAIDYDVVVKGLKNKFGELNKTNEREFRSFFDKIIQLPFQMPLASYNIENFMKELLLTVDYLTEAQTNDSNLLHTLVRFTNLSVGTNPRSIKRLVNTLSFINLLIRSKNKISGQPLEIATNYKQIIFGLTCLQTAFPDVFNLITRNPNIENWTRTFAQRNNIELTSDIPKNNIWEIIIETFCTKNEYLKQNSYNIISIVKEMQIIAETHQQKLHQILPDVVTLLAVTNVKQETIKPTIQINEIRVMYALNERLLPALKAKLTEPLEMVERKGRMIAKITYRFSTEKKNNTANVVVYVKHNNIYLRVESELELFEAAAPEKNAWQQLEQKGKAELFNQISADFISLENKHNQFQMAHTSISGLVVKKNHVCLNQQFQTIAETAEQIYATDFIENLSHFIIDYMKLIFSIKQTNWQPR